MRIIAGLMFVSTALLTGCSGIGASGDYGCKAPDGVSCMSVSGVYANSTQNNLPSQRKANGDKPAKETQYQSADKGSVIGRTISSGDPLRSKTRVLRVWVAPWEDNDGDLNDQSYAYVVADNGKWMIDHNRRNIANEFAPIKPPTGINATNFSGKQDATKTVEPSDMVSE